MYKYIALFLLYFSVSLSYGQNYTEKELRDQLDSLSLIHPGLNNKVQLNVTGLQLGELLNSLALENNLNISVDPSLNQMISYNFFDALVKDVLVFVYQNFETEMQFYGSIIAIKKRISIKPAQVASPAKKINVSYNPANEFLSVDLKQDSLWKIAEEITKLTGKNFVLAPDVRNKSINGYFQNRPFEQVIDMLTKANELEYELDAHGNIAISHHEKETTLTGPGNSKSKQVINFTTPFNASSVQGLEMTKAGNSSLNIKATEADINDVLRAAASELGIYYWIYTKPEGKVNFDLKNKEFFEIIDLLFVGTKYTYRLEDKVYLIGENNMEGMRSTQLIRMDNRTIENVKASIPTDLTTGLQINEFLELNGLVVSGNPRKIAELARFLESIDVVVPMVQIDVMILYSVTGSALETGINAGLADGPTETSGTIFPEYNVTAGANSINAFLQALNGFGILNLGQVTDNFYVQLKALETNKYIDVESTPKITTLNGHEAKISIGETTYYQQTQVQLVNSAATLGSQTTKTYEPSEANLNITITPFISADEYVTMTIVVDQKDFGARVDQNSPPDLLTQKFESMVRVKNGELILLGGLDKKKSNQSGSGVPFLSKIPVIKWFFSSRKKENEKSKLHILIRPTVTY
jgi:type IV pilus assembly protein PilQ